jgi:hypothetical protein
VIKSKIYDIFLAIGIFLAGIAVNSMQKIASETEKIRIDLAVFAQKVLENEKKIEKIEHKLDRVIKP